MITVYFESNNHREEVATFDTVELYIKCLPILEEQAKLHRMVVTESLDY